MQEVLAVEQHVDAGVRLHGLARVQRTQHLVVKHTVISAVGCMVLEQEVIGGFASMCSQGPSLQRKTKAG